MSGYTRHHFVPQFCLREFANDVARKLIGTYLIQKELYVASASIRDQAQRAGLYGSEAREKLLSQIESNAAAVLQGMVNRLQCPKRFSEDHFTLLVHVLIQSSRTPTAVAEIEEGMDQLMRIMMSRDAKMASYLGRLRLRLKDGAAQSLGMVARAIPLTIDLHYKLLHNQTATPFIMSDHPVGRYNQFMERRTIGMGCTGFASRGLQIFLPISPRVTLMLYDGDVYRVGHSAGSDLVEVNSADADVLNVLQVVNAGSQLFFNTETTRETIQALVQRSQPWMRRDRSTVTEFPQPSNESATQRSIVVASLKDIHTGLKLSKVVELPSAQGYKVTNGMSILRDPRLCELHFDFEKRVSEGLYGPMDFGRYFADVAASRVKQIPESR